MCAPIYRRNHVRQTPHGVVRRLVKARLGLRLLESIAKLPEEVERRRLSGVRYTFAGESNPCQPSVRTVRSVYERSVGADTCQPHHGRLNILVSPSFPHSAPTHHTPHSYGSHLPLPTNPAAGNKREGLRQDVPPHSLHGDVYVLRGLLYMGGPFAGAVVPRGKERGGIWGVPARHPKGGAYV